ncbi:MAG TPA: alpha/beta fold hydrolase [Gemmatimonadales bacterium]|nr:alpha/beta fold hydrolase [Gemmatimonadales bacterium]
MLLGSDTVVVERFHRSGDSLSGSVSVRGQPRIEYHAQEGPDQLIHRMTFKVYPLGSPADAPPLQEVTATLRGDSAFVEVAGQRRGYQTTTGALPLLNNSLAVTELFTRYARAHGDSLDIPGWSLSGGMMLTVSVRPRGADSMTVTIAGQVHRLRVDAVGRILGGAIPSAGITVQRVSAAVVAQLQLGRPDYSAPAGAPYTAIDVTFQAPGGNTLGGTLTMPTGVTGPVPAVVTITGSGQQDRDEYIPVAGGYRLFRQVADTLGRRGIAVLRLDDRLVGMSSGPLGTSADYADDIRAALAWLRSRPGIDGTRLGLVGHSEGGLIAPMVAATDPRLRGAVLLAGPGETGARILRFQQKQAIDGDTSIAVTARDSMYRVAAIATDSLARTSPWLAYFIQHDPLATARQVATTPILILQGGTDHQITPDQAPILANAFRAAGNTDVTTRVFPGLNHLFLPDPVGLPSGYSQLTDNKVSAEVLGALADWLVAHL